jgi:nucleotide-binding universal stress UspA family protein
MTQARMGPVVVGVDGSPGSTAAVGWACAAAESVSADLVVVHSCRAETDFLGPGRVPMPSSTVNAYRDAASELLDAEVARAEALAPSVAVKSILAIGRAGAELVEESKNARLLVVGRSGHGLARLLLGSVARHVLLHADCPVVVVPEAYRVIPIDKIVVGTDGSASSTDAIDWAISEAARRGASVEIFHAWLYPYVGYEVGAGMVTLGDVQQDAQALLDGVVKAARDRHPNTTVQIAGRLQESGTTRGLIAEGDGAQLVVVGSRGRGGFARLMLGSVAQFVAEHAPCPVVVVRPHE